MRIAFAGTPDFAAHSLLALVHYAKISTGEIVSVFCQPDRAKGRGKKITTGAVKQLAEAQGLPLWQPSSIATQESLLQSLDLDLLIVVAYGQILPASILHIPRHGCWNVHASLLPRWRGAAPIQRCIEAGDAQTGISIMQMDVGLDSGALISQVALAVEQKNTATLHDELAQLGAKELVTQLARLQQLGRIDTYSQHHSQATYAKKLNKQESVVDWQQPRQTVLQKIRAFYPWPLVRILLRHNDQHLPLQIVAAEASELAKSQHPTGIPYIAQQQLSINCADSALRITQVKPAGKGIMSDKSFINGYQQWLTSP